MDLKKMTNEGEISIKDIQILQEEKELNKEFEHENVDHENSSHNMDTCNVVGCKNYEHHQEIHKETLSQRIQRNYSQIKPFLLSHHPHCEKFKNHTFRLFSKDFCIGCYIGYSSAILGIIISNILFKQHILPSSFFLLVGILMSLFQFLSLTKITKIKKIKMIQKFFIGFGSGFILIYFWYLSDWIWYLTLLFELLIIFILNIPIGILHFKTHEKICIECEWKNNWNQCPGFSQITSDSL
jgi:hypothetical protein